MSLMAKRQAPGEGLRRHLMLTRKLQAEAPLDLVVWSETSVTSAVPEGDIDVEYPRRFTRGLGVPAVFGAVLYREVADARRYALFNRRLRKSGAIRGVSKTYLLAFGSSRRSETPSGCHDVAERGRLSKGTSPPCP
jgi:hypothetical protein